MNNEKKKVIIVEGKNDELRVKQVLPGAHILKTNGNALTDEFLDLVRKLSVDHQIILLLDPDYNGEMIRKKVASVCHNAAHVFVKREDAISKNKRKIGVEHVSLDTLKVALSEIKYYNYKNNFTIQDIYDLGLAGNEMSRQLRIKLCNRLGIGYVNAKQLVNRLNLFNYTIEEIRDML